MNNYQNPYGVNRFQPYYTPYYQPVNQNLIQNQNQSIQPVQQNQIQQTIPNIQPMGLLGKCVDNLEVVKATDIPLDGSISYFPLMDGSCIATKQLQLDGSSKVVVYKPVVEELKEEKETENNYLTIDDFNKGINKIDTSNLTNEIQDLKEKIEELTNSLKNVDKTTSSKK